MKNELFRRYPGNPILKPSEWLYPVYQVLNPAAVEYNKETVLLVRVVDRRNYSHLSLAKSKNGEIDWEIDSKPTLEADLTYREFRTGLEDPRIVWVEELQEFIIACVSFRAEYENKPCGIKLIGTKSFSAFRRIGQVLEPENKNASLFPRRIKDLFALIHRPTVGGRPYIAVSFSKDLVFWGKGRPLFSTRECGWDNNKIGLGCPPIETKKGWLLIYHGFGGKANKFIYRVGLALLDIENLRLIRRSEEWVFGPEKDYEGGPDGIVFPCGCIVKNGELRIYYGTNDSNIGLAQANMDEVLDYLMECPEK